MSGKGLMYIDSSIILAHLLREMPSSSWANWKGDFVTSELTDLESRRTLDRIRLHEQLSDEEVSVRLNELDQMLNSMRVFELTAAILKRAKSSFPTVVRSLDAIHLATAELSNCTEFRTLDRQQAIGARAIGLMVDELAKP